MARKIKRFFVFMFFSLFFTVPSKKFQSMEASSKTNELASAKGVKSPNPVAQALFSVIGAKSAEAGCYNDGCEWICDGGGSGGSC